MTSARMISARRMAVLAALLLVSVAFATAPELIYKDYTNRPSFYCPDDAYRCELYQLTGKFNKNITPILKASCLPATQCNFLSISNPTDQSIRWLPGDWWSIAARFEGYKVFDESPVFQPPAVHECEQSSDCAAKPNMAASCIDYKCQYVPVTTCQRVCGRYSVHGLCMSWKKVCS